MFIQQSNLGNTRWWKFLVVLIGLILSILYLGQLPLWFFLSRNEIADSVIDKFLQTNDFSTLGIDENLALLLQLWPFVIGFFYLLFLYPLVHEKPTIKMITSRISMDWGRVFYAFLLWLGLTCSVELLVYFYTPDNYTYQLDWARFLPLLLIAFVLLPIQTSFEELLFRGYLLQGFSLVSAYRWIPILLTSVLFGMMHTFNPEVQQFGFAIMMPYYIGIGLLLAVCTVMDEGIEIALGVHAATNIYNAILVSFSGSALQTPSIFRVEELDLPLVMTLSLFTALVFLYLVARKYHWKDWTKLTRGINFKNS